MKTELRWLKPIQLSDGSHENFIYTFEDFSSIPESPGIYVFARCFGEAVEPLYVGKANSLRTRVKQQLNNVRLMKGIQQAKIGPRVLFLAPLRARPGQNLFSVLALAESALIEHFSSAGWELLNTLGTALKMHAVSFSGTRGLTKLLPPKILVPIRRARADA